MNMRKRILLTALLFTMVFSMVACGKEEAVGKDDTSPIQTEAPTEVPKPTETPTAEPTEAPTPTPRPEVVLKLELKGTDNPRIDEILDFSGEFMDELNNMKSNYS